MIDFRSARESERRGGGSGLARASRRDGVRRLRWRGHGLASMVVAALVCLLLTAAIVVLTPRPVTQIAVVVDYHPDLVRFERAAPYTVLAPEGLPVGWRPINSRLTVAPDGPVSWHLGYVTPSGQNASLEESNERPAQFILRMTNNGNRLPPVWSGGTWWGRSWRQDKKQRAMYQSGPGPVTVIVTGTAGWAELSALAVSLRPQP